MGGIKCPRCGLFNPDTAQRCDCGYDFETRSVKSAYFKQELPRQFKTYLLLSVTINPVLAGAMAIAGGGLTRILVFGAWSAGIWWLYSRLNSWKLTREIYNSDLPLPVPPPAPPPSR